LTCAHVLTYGAYRYEKTGVSMGKTAATPILLERDVAIGMRDGITTSADIWRAAHNFADPGSANTRGTGSAGQTTGRALRS
jgi:predicted acyl esterase